jgi:uncharacterized damage-inducible protein DinB
MLHQMASACEVLENLHTEILDLLEKTGPERMNQVPPAQEANSMYALATHAAASQLWWISENLVGIPIARDRPAEFVSAGKDLSKIRESFQEVEHTTREILGSLTEDQLQETRVVRGKNCSVEWIVLHVIEHTALHLGHMQITQQWIEGIDGL